MLQQQTSSYLTCSITSECTSLGNLSSVENFTKLRKMLENAFYETKSTTSMFY